jgi:hypothetical protein
MRFRVVLVRHGTVSRDDLSSTREIVWAPGAERLVIEAEGVQMQVFAYKTA